TGYTCCRHEKVRSVNARHRGAKGDREINVGRICWVGAGPNDGVDEGTRLVDDIHLAGVEIAVAGRWAAERQIHDIPNRVVINHIKTQVAIARTGVDRHRVVNAVTVWCETANTRSG